MSFAPGVIAGLPYSTPPPVDTGLPRVSATHWRLSMPVTAGQGNFYVAEIEMRATEGGADQCSGGTPSAFSSSSGATNAFDNNAGTSWFSSTSASENGWIQYQFASAVEVVEIVVTHRPCWRERRATSCCSTRTMVLPGRRSPAGYASTGRRLPRRR